MYLLYTRSKQALDDTSDKVFHLPCNRVGCLQPTNEVRRQVIVPYACT